MIRIPDVLLGQRARALESASCVETSYFGWGFICPDTECVVHGDGVSTPLKVIKKKLPAKPLAGCISFYGIFYIRCENGYLYEYNPSTRTVLRSFYVGGDGATWVSVSDNICAPSVVTPIMYVLTQGVPGELVAIRLPDGALFRSNMGFGDFKGGTIEATSAGYGDTLQETTPSQVASPGVDPMGPLECVLVNSTGSICVVHFTPIGGFRHRYEYVNKIPATPLRLLKPFVSSAPIPIPPLGPYSQSYVLSVRKVVSAYTGKCMRVRRSSNNQEQDIPFKDGWIDEASLLSFVGSGNGFVTAWYNQTPQYGTTSFIMTNVVRQPKIVENGVIRRSGAKQKPTVFFRWTTEYLGRAGGGYSVYAAATGVFISMLTSKIPDSFFGDSTTSMFWEFPANGINGLGIGRYWLPEIKNHQILIGNDFFYVDDSDIYPSTPFVDYSASCTPAGVVTVYRKGEKALSTNVQRIDGWGGLVNQFQITCGGYSYNMNISEVIVQSQAWSEATQESFAQNQRKVFGTPGGY